MPVRTTMADLISRVRELIGDEAGADQVFSDLQIQDSLDSRRHHKVREPLTAVSSIAVNGVTSYFDHYSQYGYFEADVDLQDGSYADISGSLAANGADYLRGRFTFSASKQPPVFLTGFAYDVYAAAADMLEMWMANTKTDYDFLSSGRTFKRSQQGEGIERLLKVYRSRQWVTTSPMVRTDMNY